jgi:ankyrin repeat protein
LSVSLAAQTAPSPLPPAAQIKVDYDTDVKPILAQHCYACHGDAVQQAGLRLDLRQNALRGGDYGPVIIPGKSAESKLIKRVVDGDGAMQMPPSGPLSADDIGILRAWIDQGVEFRTIIADVPPTPTDPKTAALIAAVRTQTPAALATLLDRDRDVVTARDQAGSTLLHHAAGFGRLETLTLLLEAGADVNAKNRRNATPLHWAIHDEAKVRLLLSHGAAVNARQAEGRTPLYLAASLGDGAATLKLLLEQGADPRLATATGMTPLMAAAVRGDVAALRLLADAKAEVNATDGAGETALMLAATNGSADAVGFLLDHGADARVRSKRQETALGNAGTAGVEATVRLLLDHGAEVNVRNIRGYSPLMLAAGSDAVPSGAVTLLLAKGADTTYTTDHDETARDLASKRGDTAVVRLLGGLSAKTNPVATAAAPANGTERRSIAGAVEKALGLLAKQSDTFIRTAGCNSCHSQDLVSAANGVARGRGLHVPVEIPQLPASMMPSPERLMDLAVVSVPGTAWELVDFGMNAVPRNAYTDAAVRLITTTQLPDGHWSSNASRRPPMNAGEFQAAAVCIYALQHYGASGDAATAQALAKGVAWLERARPETTQDLAFQVIGLAWGSARASETAKTAAHALVARQRADGGWSQFPGLASDAYATGQALYALSLSGRGPATDAASRQGIAYLLTTQAADGSWRVASRSIWLQPYFESGFPYGQDQFISTAGTAWASMALAAAVQPLENTQR